MKSVSHRYRFAAASLALCASVLSSIAHAQQASSTPATPAPAAAPTRAPIEVEPGVRFGALRLGMSRAQVSVAMPGLPLRPDTAEGDPVDGSSDAFIGSFTVRFARSGELIAITARILDFMGGIRIGTQTLPRTANAASVVAVLSGCRPRVQVGGGYTTLCTGVDVEDMTGASGLRLRVHR